MLAHGDPVSHVVAGVAAALATLLFADRWRRQASPPTRHLLAWSGGIAAVLVSTAPPVERLADERFAWHMVQHLGLIVVAAPLFVLAHPGRLVDVHALHRALRPIARRWRAIGPLVAAGVFVAVLVVTHLTPIYDRAIRDQLVHDAEHVAYLGSAVALWAAVRTTSRQHAVRRIGAVFAVTGGSALLGMILLTAPRPLIATYEGRLGESAALDDQRAAAAIMWISGMATTLPLLVGAFWRWAASEQRAAQRAEQLLDVPTRPG